MNVRKSAHKPTATAPDEVSQSIPGAVKWAGSTGPDAADPPRAKGKHGERASAATVDAPNDQPLDRDEGADAFETHSEAASSERENSPQRRDENVISIDTPD